MISAFAFGLAASGRLFDFIDGKAFGFGRSFSEIRVDCFTDQGVKIVANHRCIVNPDGTWCITVDEGPTNVKSYTVVVHPDNCLSKMFHVKVPKTGRPTLSIDLAKFARGDFNANNVIDSSDVFCVKQAVGSRKSPRFDINRDGIVDRKDVTIVRRNLGRR